MLKGYGSGQGCQGCEQGQIRSVIGLLTNAVNREVVVPDERTGPSERPREAVRRGGATVLPEDGPRSGRTVRFQAKVV